MIRHALSELHGAYACLRTVTGWGRVRCALAAPVFWVLGYKDRRKLAAHIQYQQLEGNYQ